MEEKNRSFIHDTINLDEIRDLIQDEPQPDILAAEAMPPSKPDPKPDIEKQEQAAKQEKEKTSFMYELYGMLHDLTYILAFVTLLFVFVVRLVGVDGTSMLPTLHHGDFLLLESNFLYNTDDIQYGDIVVLNEPYHWGRDKTLIVKRVIATEGQSVDINFDTHEVFVNGTLLQENYINEPTAFNWNGEMGLDYPVTVPEGHIFVLGDNRNNSSDSRFAPVGMIDERCVLGKAIAIAFPGETKDSFGNVIDARNWSRIGLVK